MKRLNRSILEDYEIRVNGPQRLCGVQIGDDRVLMGLVDRLLDDANAKGANVGLAVVQPGETGFASALKEQDGMFTVFVRGEVNEKPVHREQVVQSVLEALDPVQDDARLLELAADEGIRFLILNTDETGEYADRDRVCAAIAARMLAERWRKGAAAVAVIVCGNDVQCANALKSELLGFAAEWGVADEFGAWLDGCRFFPALADSLVFRSSAEEAARLCTQMNYADAMIHLAEPYGLWSIQADAAFCEEFPLDVCEQIRFTNDLSGDLIRKTRIFDAGLFSLTALGCLHGNETLAECMKDEPLRDFVGHALLDEVLPYMPFDRDALIPYIIACYERYSNPMNDNLLWEAGRGLVHKFNVGILPALRAYADEHFEPPKSLTVALAAAILFYADARLHDAGYETVVGQTLVPVHESADVLSAFSRLASDMDPESLAYAVLSDRTLWADDLRQIPGLEEAVISNLQS